MSRVTRALWLACGLLTIVPVHLADNEVVEADLAASRYAFPVVGLAIGLVLAAMSELLGASPPLLAAFVLVAVGCLLSGGLHLDGLADTADGLFLTGGPEHRLAVMRDPHVGSFGVVAIVLVLLGKLTALASLPSTGHARSLAIIAAVAISRTLILVCAGSARYARPEGTGRVVVEATTFPDALGAAVVVVVLGLVLARAPGLVASLVALAVAWGLTRVASKRVGGVTGDTLGALVELGELVILVTLGLLQSIPTK
ncbi:MAG TPA: adenosylcobinamide-GDP ribazoletransferase [Isosphaeraceae bacterium]|jgi:adenosylcobinamide-GDP ribazoletransferase|nr:adenosylcobinamide-GDP ribazoletransferase [Isosphaeraceae bacterium]